MRKWTKTALTFLVVLAMLACVACSGALETPEATEAPAVEPAATEAEATEAPAEEAAPETQVVLTLGHVQSDGDNVAQDYALALQEAAAKYGIQIDIYPGGQLGDSSALVEGVQMGTVDINITGTSEYAKLYSDMGVLDLAYIWSSYEQMNRVLDGELGQKLAQGLLETANVRVLGYSDSFGYRCVGTVGEKNVFTNLEEAKALNLKIRTIESTVYINSIQAMGFNPTPMGFGEVYTALQTNVIDGYEHDANTTLANAFYEVIDNYMLTNHMCGPMGLFMSEISFQKLTPEQQENLLKAAKEASEAHRALAPVKEQESLDKLRQSGVNVVEVDVQSFADAVNAFNEEYCAEQGWTDNYNIIKAAS